MQELSDLFDDNFLPENTTACFSLSGQLEAIVGGYAVQGEYEAAQNQEAWITVYYDVQVDPEDFLCEEIIAQQNLIAYVALQARLAFVLEKNAAKFEQDTAGHGLRYIPILNFSEECYCCYRPSRLPEFLQQVVWIDDTFLHDESAIFDFAAFAKIDDGVQYLNPAHFSIQHLINYLQKQQWLKNR